MRAAFRLKSHINRVFKPDGIREVRMSVQVCLADFRFGQGEHAREVSMVLVWIHLHEYSSFLSKLAIGIREANFGDSSSASECFSQMD